MTADTSKNKTMNDLAQEFSSIAGYLQAVGETLEQGHMPDMKGLDKRVGRLCEQIMAADREVQQRFIGELNELLKHITACEEKLHSCAKSLGKEMK